MKSFFTTFIFMAVSILNSHADTLTIAMVGDIMMGTTFPSEMLPANNGKDLFREAKPMIVQADLAVGNLEGTLCDNGKSTKGNGPNSYAFRTPTSYAPNLKDAGFDFLSMANNHANDFGLEGIESTEKCLQEQGILFSGIEGRTESVVIERKGKKIGICAFGHNSYTIKHLNLDNVARIVDDLVNRCDLVIVSFHGGAEGKNKCHLPLGTETFLGENRGSLREFAHFCIDHGADIVYGHGPHVTRAIEVYNGNLSGISGHAPLITISIDDKGNFLHGDIHPMIQTRGIGPRNDKTGSVVKQIKMLSETDIPKNQAHIDEKGHISLRK